MSNIRALFGWTRVTRLPPLGNGQQTFYGYIIRGRPMAEYTAALLSNITGEQCTLVERGHNTFVIYRNNGSGEVLA